MGTPSTWGKCWKLPRNRSTNSLYVRGYRLMGNGQFLADAVMSALEVMRIEGCPVIMEGAGTPAKGSVLGKLANITSAEVAGARCLLVVDAQTGGPVVSALGTLELLDARGFDRNRLGGLILNRGIGPRIDNWSLEYFAAKTSLSVLGDASYAPYGSERHSRMQVMATARSAGDRGAADRWYDMLAATIGSQLNLPDIMALLEYRT
jgi:cobyric acid synthase